MRDLIKVIEEAYLRGIKEGEKRERERVWFSAYRAGQADARADIDTKDLALTNK